MAFNVDHIARVYGMDASETAYFARQLLEIRKQVYKVRYAQNRAMDFVPPEAQKLNPGATHFTAQAMDMVATENGLASSMSSRSPRVDITATEMTPIPFRSIRRSYGYNLQEIRAAMMAGVDLPGGKATAARTVIEQIRDDVLLLGDGSAAYLGCYGLFKLSGTHTYSVPNGAKGSPLWSRKSPDEVVADMHGICNGIITNSKEVENPDTLILPLTAYTYAATNRMGDGASMMILDFFLATRQKMRPGFTVETSVKLETAGGGSGTRMIAYERNPEKVARLDSVEFEQFPPQLEGLDTLVECHSRTAGVWSPVPKSISYGDGI